MNVSAQRRHFDTSVAPGMLASIGCQAAKRWSGPRSARFSYFEDDDRFILMSGDQEGRKTELVLAYGLSQLPEGKRLVLVVPAGTEAPIQQRLPWLKLAKRSHLYVHDGSVPSAVELVSRADAVAALTQRLGDGMTLAEELRRATAPHHLGDTDHGIEDLVERATKHPLLDPGHRRGERSWHCMGLRVLSIRRTTEGTLVRSGVHTSVTDGDDTVLVPKGGTLADMDTVWLGVEAGIAARLSGSYQKPDEHWLQAVIRRDPTLVGVEQPALREVPAWRPTASSKRWGRGYIDLLGLDGHGDIRLVETKLAANDDELLVLQGLDYYVWARAYLDLLRERLGAPARSRLVVHFVVGAGPNGRVHVSPHARRHAKLLDVPWRFQIVRGWSGYPHNAVPSAEVLPPGALPDEAPFGHAGE